MDKLDKDLDKMMDKLKYSTDMSIEGYGGQRGKRAYIYESPDGGKTLYSRPMGAPSSQRKLVTRTNQGDIS